MHEVPLPTLIQLAVLRNLGQEGVLGIKRSARKDKDPLGYSPAGSQCCRYPGVFSLPPGQAPVIWESWLMVQSTNQVMLLLYPQWHRKQIVFLPHTAQQLPSH